MAGFPLTAWAIRHPWGATADEVFDRLRGSIAPIEPTTPMLVDELLDELAPQRQRAVQRWGASRLAAIVGRAETARSAVHPLDGLRPSFAGGVYDVLATGMGGVLAWSSAYRLLRASLADAVLVLGVQDDRASAGLVERHGEAFVELTAAAEAIATASEAAPMDEAALRTVVGEAMQALGPPGYVHCQTRVDEPDGAAERQALRETVGSIPCCTTRRPPVVEASARDSDCGATDVVVAATSLVRGFAPAAPAHELEHDRVLLHAFDLSGRHAAVVLEARP